MNSAFEGTSSCLGSSLIHVMSCVCIFCTSFLPPPAAGVDVLACRLQIRLRTLQLDHAWYCLVGVGRDLEQFYSSTGPTFESVALYHEECLEKTLRFWNASPDRASTMVAFILDTALVVLRICCASPITYLPPRIQALR